MAELKPDPEETARRPTWPQLTLAVLLLAAAYGPSFVEGLRRAADPAWFNDDVRQQIFPFYRYTDTGPDGPDLLGDYQLALMPAGFRLLYRAAAPVVDPVLLSKAIPYFLFALSLAATAAVASRIGGRVSGLLAAALVLQGSMPFSRLAGGMPRAFGFALVALGVWALAAGRARRVAAAVVVTQAFYSVAAAVLALCLVLLLFVLPRHDRGDAASWSLRRRLAVVGLVGLLCLVEVLPVAAAVRPWGRLMGPGDAATYPEVGPGGRHAAEDLLPQHRNPLPGLARFARDQIDEALRGAPPFWHLPRPAWSLAFESLLLLAAAGGIVLLARADAAARRALLVPAAGVGGFVLATLGAPYFYLPQRYLSLTLPLFVAALLAPSGAALAERLVRGRRLEASRSVGALVLAGGSLLLLGARGNPDAAYTVHVDPEAPLYAAVRTLPRNALIAGFPSGPVQDVPYLCRRRALLTQENHLEFNLGYLLETRRRMHAVVRALFSGDPQALRTLRDEFGVTHLIVDLEHYREPPFYFAPFGADIERLWRKAGPHGFAAVAADSAAVVLRQDSLVLLDLSKL